MVAALPLLLSLGFWWPNGLHRSAIACNSNWNRNSSWWCLRSNVSCGVHVQLTDANPCLCACNLSESSSSYLTEFTHRYLTTTTSFLYSWSSFSSWSSLSTYCSSSKSYLCVYKTHIQFLILRRVIPATAANCQFILDALTTPPWPPSLLYRPLLLRCVLCKTCDRSASVIITIRPNIRLSTYCVTVISGTPQNDQNVHKATGHTLRCCCAAGMWPRDT